jgi:lysophospholipase L1-like esterase
MDPKQVDQFPFAKKLVFSLIIMSMCFLTLEAGIRIRDYVTGRSPSFWRYPYIKPIDHLYLDHPYLGVTLQPNAYYFNGDYTISINSQGYRGPPFQYNKASDVYRIVCIGASSTFGQGVSDEHTYPVYLEKKLAEQMPDRRFEVINAGVPGYTSAECLIYFLLTVQDLEPDMITIYLRYNDFKANRFPELKSDYSHWRKPGERRQATGFLADMAHMFEAYSLFYYKMKFLMPKFPSNPLSEKRDLYPRYDTVTDEGVDAFKRNLRGIIEVAQANRIAVGLINEGLCITPENLKVYPDRFADLMNFVPTLTEAGLLDAKVKYGAAAAGLASELHLPWINGSEHVPATFEFFSDHVHLTPKGNQLLAEEIAKLIDGELTRPESEQLNSLY